MSIAPRNCLLEMRHYQPGTSLQDVSSQLGLDQIIKLSSNENPLGCPISLDALQESLSNAALYPHQASARLLDQISKEWGIEHSSIVLGNGSDDILQMIGLAFLNPGDQVMVFEHGFSVYTSVAQVMQADLISLPLNDYRMDLPVMAQQITDKTRVVFLTNPYSPTGTAVSEDELSTFLAAIPPSTLVVLDEAYWHYLPTRTDSPDLVRDFKNLIVTRTFSKLYGLAGFRIGYAVGNPDIIAPLQKVRMPFNVNALALTVASLAYEATEYVQDSLTTNTSGKEQIYTAFKDLNIDYVPTTGNFICFFTDTPAQGLVHALLKQGISIRDLASFGLPHAARVSIGTTDQNNTFIQALKEII